MLINQLLSFVSDPETLHVFVSVFCEILDVKVGMSE